MYDNQLFQGKVLHWSLKIYSCKSSELSGFQGEVFRLLCFLPVQLPWVFSEKGTSRKVEQGKRYEQGTVCQH